VTSVACCRLNPVLKNEEIRLNKTNCYTLEQIKSAEISRQQKTSIKKWISDVKSESVREAEVKQIKGKTMKRIKKQQIGYFLHILFGIIFSHHHLFVVVVSGILFLAPHSEHKNKNNRAREKKFCILCDLSSEMACNNFRLWCE
jgi:hypothetical protein